MPLRLFVDPIPAEAGAVFPLPEGAARHAQVRRVQPGDALVLFDGSGAEWPAEVVAMGRTRVDVRAGTPERVGRELASAVTLLVGMPANERMDTLVEKAAELGVARLVPLVCERSVLRLVGERAAKKREHWQGVAIAACEQCGRARVPEVLTPQPLAAALAALAPPAADERRWVLAPGAPPLPSQWPGATPPAAVLALSGPEGGLAPAELAAAQAAGFAPAGLGPRVLRADTAPLALLAWIGLQAGG